MDNNLYSNLKLVGNSLFDIGTKQIEQGKNTVDNDFKLMCLVFLSKQLDHLKTVMMLEKSSDTILIARSMIEGKCLLRYARNNSDFIPSQWKEYYLISRYKMINSRKDYIEDSSNLLKELEIRIKESCDKFIINNKSNKSLKIGDNLYYLNWFKEKSITSIIKEFGDSYDIIKYSEFSIWHHWDPLFQEKVLTVNDNKILYESGLDNIDIVGLISVCYACLSDVIGTYAIVSDNKDLLSKLQEINKKYDSYSNGY